MRGYLEDGEERGFDGGLEEVDEEEHVSVGRERFEDGRVEVVEFGPTWGERSSATIS